MALNKIISPAIQRKMEINRQANKNKLGQDMSNRLKERNAYNQANKTKKPVNYTTSRQLGEKEGFSPTDYGIGKGAGIPYQIKTETKTARPGPHANITSPGSVKPSTSRLEAMKRKMSKPKGTMPGSLPKRPLPGEK